MQRAILRDVDLSRANLDRADLTDSVLADARMQGTKFGRAELGGVVFRNCYLEGADLSQARGLPSFDRVQYDEATRWPAQLPSVPDNSAVIQRAVSQMDLGEYLAWRAEVATR